MSVANKVVEPFIESSHKIKSENVIVDKRFSAESEQPKPKVRSWFIFILLLISVSIFVYDRFYFSVVPVVEEMPEPIAIDSVLVNRPFEQSLNANKAQAPDSVIDFINAYQFLPKQSKVENEDKVVIYEIIDQVDNKRKITVFLTEAKALLKADKLTSPKGNNAFERYQMVLSLDAANKEALNGIERIVDRYVTLAERVIKKNENYKVAGLIKSANLVGAGYIDMRPILAKYAKYIDDQSVFINLATELESEQSKKTNVADNNQDTVAIEGSLTEVDREIALAASKLLDSNDIDGAVAVLKRFTQLSDYWGQSYDLLLSLYIKQAKMKEAEALVTNNTGLDTFQMAEKVARLFIGVDDTAGALHLLGSYSPDIKRYNEYYAIKAGLYHDSGRYDEAIKIYRALIKIDYDNSRYWLGLAVSLDAIADANALEAFHYAYDYAAPNSRVKEYIEQRLLVLSP